MKISSPPLPLILSISILMSIFSSWTVNAGVHYELGRAPSMSTCRGSIAECLSVDEFTMDSEINRRILATSQYISYEALKRDSVPCSRRGQSYYNCQPNAQANPYVRGCNQITQCRG